MELGLAVHRSSVKTIVLSVQELKLEDTNPNKRRIQSQMVNFDATCMHEPAAERSDFEVAGVAEVVVHGAVARK